MTDTNTDNMPPVDISEILEFVDVAACAWDASYRITYLNDRYRRLFDTPPEDLYVGMTIEELFSVSARSGKIGIVTNEQGRQTAIQQIRDLRELTVTQHVSKDGRLFERHRRPLKNGGGCALLRDVTSTQKSAPDPTTDMLSQFIHYLPDGCGIYDPDDRLLTCNSLFAELYDSVPEDLIGLKFIEIFAVGDAKNAGIPKGQTGLKPGTTTLKCRETGVSQARFIIQSRDGRHFLVQENLLPSGHILSFRTDISDTIATDDAIRRSGENVSSVNRLARIGSWSMKPSTEILEWSDEQFRLFGYEPGELVPTRGIFNEHLHPDEKDIPGRTTENSINNHDTEQWVEFRIIRKDGAVRWLSSYRQYFYSESGELLRVNGVSQDITDRKAIEEEVERSRALLQNAIESMESGFRLLDSDGYMITCNQRYRDLYPEIADLLRPGVPIEEMRRQYYAMTGTLYHGGGVISDEQFTTMKPLKRFETRTRSGNWITVSESLTPDGGLVSVATEITAYKEIEQRLAKSEARFRSITEISTDWFWEAVFDSSRKLRYKFLSSRFYEFTGLREEQTIGVEFGHLPVDYRTILDSSDAAASIEAGMPFRNLVLGHYTADGKQVYCRLSAKPVIDNNGVVTGYLGIGQDITRERQQANELQKAKELAESANQAKSDFLASMSHELRTPLNAIIGFSELMQGEVYGPIGKPQYLEYIGDILASGNHLLTLINDILDLSKIEAGAWKPHYEQVRITDVAERCQRLFARQMKKRGVRFEFQSDKTLPEIWSDSRALLQIIANLMSNAVKFTGDGGSVKLAITVEGDDIVITVSDSGVGIPEADLIRVLEPFEQVESVMERRHQGTGLGLSIVRSLIEILQGTFTLTSEQNVGTTAIVKLPVKSPPKN